MRLIILGAGGHGQVIYETALLAKTYIEGGIFFLDDRYSRIGDAVQEYGTVQYQISGTCNSFTSYIDNQTEFYPAFGDNKLRLQWEEKIINAGGKLATLIHPCACVARSVCVEAGSAVLANAIVNTGTKIGRGCIINIGAIIEHGCAISNGCHINAGAIVMAENCVPPLTKVESGEIVPMHSWQI